MPRTSNERKAELLGMPFGTANGRLKKILLFHLAKQLSLDSCYRCGKKITEVDTFSVEHKESWAYAEDPIKTFFDLDNISYSHTSCNIAAAYHPNKKYVDGVERKHAEYAIIQANPEKMEKHLKLKRERYHRNKGTS